jgi:hypothetical protein
MHGFKLLLIFVAILYTSTAHAQQAKNAAGISAGANYSDVNYGSEFLYQYLPVQDYNSISSSGEGFYAYDVGLNYSRVLSNSFSLSVGLIYSVLNYKIDGEVTDLKPDVMRPPSPDIPVSVDGVVKYSFLNFEAGLDYSFNSTINRGLFLSFDVNSMLHLNTNWYMNVVNEDQSEWTDKNIADTQQPDYNTLWFIGLGAGYHIRLGEDHTLTPLIGFKYGFNPIVDGTLEPTVINLSLALNRWF